MLSFEDLTFCQRRSNNPNILIDPIEYIISCVNLIYFVVSISVKTKFYKQYKDVELKNLFCCFRSLHENDFSSIPYGSFKELVSLTHL